MENKISFGITKNPRPSSYELGPIRCNACLCQTSVYLEIQTENDDFNICTSCLNLGIKMIQKAILKDI